jgi:catechol 2,3-dioxygenase-like lactoylglutathione lyase family enzyme
LEGEQAFAGWTYCYNMPAVARRVHDILAVMAWFRGERPRGVPIDLVGLGQAGPWAGLALAQADGAVARAAIDTRGFRFGALTDVYDIDFLPGAARYGDLPGAIALAAPTPLWLASEGPACPAVIDAAYRAAGQPNRVQLARKEIGSIEEAAVAWLIER